MGIYPGEVTFPPVPERFFTMGKDASLAGHILAGSMTYSRID